MLLGCSSVIIERQVATAAQRQHPAPSQTSTIKPTPGPVRGVLRQWDEIPGPGEHFAEADAAIRARVVALIEELASRMP